LYREWYKELIVRQERSFMGVLGIQNVETLFK